MIQASIFSETEESNLNQKEIATTMTVLLDNIRSVYNVGSIFRTCEGLGDK